MLVSVATNGKSTNRALAWIERTGNRLPDPVIIFFYLIIALIGISVICELLGVSAMHPTQIDQSGNPKIEQAVSLLSASNIQRLWIDMPQTFTHFHPLGYVLVVMLGAGIAERSGFFASAIRAALANAPKQALTPFVAIIAMVSNHAADAGYVIVIPIAAIIYAAAGRHPILGIGVGFAGVSGGFSANLTPGGLDALLFGITESAYQASGIDAGWSMNIAGNWWFIIALLVLYIPVIWWVADRIIEPMLGKWNPADGADTDGYQDVDAPLTGEQRRGLRHGYLALLGVALFWTAMTFGPGTPLLNDGPEMATAPWYTIAAPFFQSLVAAFFALFLMAGWAYGRAAGTIKKTQDLVDMMTDAMKDMAYYLVLAFFAAHFVAMFNWSNLGLISAVHGADAIRNSGLPLPIVLGLIVLFAGLLNLFVGSASAKWALLSPVLVPMLMLLGISPDGATAAYRVGDSATNIITPIMVYFPLVLVFAQRWQKNFGLGSLTAMMIPYSIWMLISGTLLMMIWLFLGLPLGPGAPANIAMPG